MGWQHRYKPAGGYVHKPASGIPAGGEGWGPARGYTKPTPFSAENQPPPEIKSVAQMEAKEFREKLRARLGRVLESYDRALDSENPDHGLKASDAITKRLYGDYKQTVETQPDTRTDEEIAADIARRQKELDG